MKPCIVTGILLVCCLVQPARAEWTALNISSNLSVNVFLSQRASMFAGTDHGVFRTTNQGVSWEEFNSGLVASNGVVPSVLSLAAVGDTLIAGTDSYRAFLSPDGGETWTAIDNGMKCKTVYALAVDGGMLVAGTDSGIYITNDFGLHWVASNTGLPSSATRISSLAESGNMLMAGTPAGVYFSLAQGQWWLPANTGLNTDTNIVAIVAVTDITYLATSRGSVYSSVTISGASWKNVSSNLSIDSIAQNVIALAATDYTVFVSNRKGIFGSVNSGTKWDTLNTGLPKISGNFKGFGALHVEGNLLLAGATGDNAVVQSSRSMGVYRSTNTGTSWEPMNAGFSHNYLYVYQAACSGSTVVMGAATPPGFVGQTAVWRSNDNGQHIVGSQIDECDPRSMIMVNDTVIAGVMSSYTLSPSWNPPNTYHAGIVLSLDSGKSWSNITDTVSREIFSTKFDSKAGITTFSRFAYSSARMVATVSADDGGVFLSTDRGHSWQRADTGLPHFSPPNSKLAAPVQYTAVGLNMYAATPLGVYGISDAATTWISDTSGMGPKNVTAILADGISRIFAATDTSMSNGSSDKIFMKWGGGGQSWTPITNGLPPGTNGRDFKKHGEDIFLASDHGVYRTNDQGQKWTSVVDGMRDQDINFIAATDSFLFVSAATGIYRRPLSEVTAVNEPQPVIPHDAMLSQNFPDPFSATTTIEYLLPSAETVTLRVTNMLGEVVAEQLQGRQEAGMHHATFTPHNLKSGVYWCTLKTGANILTRSLTFTH